MTLAFALLIAISIGIENAVSVIKKEFGLDVKTEIKYAASTSG